MMRVRRMMRVVNGMLYKIEKYNKVKKDETNKEYDS